MATPRDPETVVFVDNAIRPFDRDPVSAAAPPRHDCQAHLAPFATAAGNGNYEARTFSLDQCTVCGLGFTNPVPSEETVHLLYTTRESNDFQPGDSSLVSRLKGLATRRDIRKFLRGLKLPDGPVLDYGCGNAAFAVALQQVLPERNVFGADLQVSPPEALGPSHYLTYEALAASSERYAFILCRHVLEHSYDPVGMVSTLSGLLRPGGVLVIEVPSLDASLGKVFGKYWDNFYVPFHPIHFTQGSLAAVVKATGLELVREGGAEMPKVGRSLHKLIGGKYHMGLFALGMALHPLQVVIGKMTGTSVCLRVWARKA